MKRTAVATMVKIPGDRLEFEVGGVTFGDQKPVVVSPSVEVPETLASLADILRAESKLLQLQAGSSLMKDQILQAYGEDVALLEQRMKDLDDCVWHAIRCSVVVGGDRQLTHEKREERARAVWQQHLQYMPGKPVQHELRLDYTLAAQEPAQILSQLQQQFQRSLASALHRLAAQLKNLVDHECIGLVTWAGLDACRYHYYVMEHREYVEGVRVDVSTSYLGGGIMEARTTRSTNVKKVQYRARHTHHLINAKLQNIGQYHHKMPSRIEQFLQSLPPRMRHLLQIVDGQETLNEVAAQKVGESTAVENELISVYRYDPAVTVGDFVLIGWDDQEIQAERARVRAYRWNLIKICAPSCLVILAIMSVVLGAAYGISTLRTNYLAGYAEKMQQAYDEFMAAVPAGKEIVTKKGELVPLGTGVHVTYSGLHKNPESELVVLRFGKGGSPEFWRVSLAPNSLPEKAVYGRFNLDARGIPFTLHVLEATNESMRYRLEELNSPVEKAE